MEVQTVTFTRKMTFDRYCNEEFIVTARIEPGEDPHVVMDTLRVMVNDALERSKLERERESNGRVTWVSARSH